MEIVILNFTRNGTVLSRREPCCSLHMYFQSVTSQPMRSANLNVVALVIHDHAGTHVPVQYIQAYIQALLVQ